MGTSDKANLKADADSLAGKVKDFSTSLTPGERMIFVRSLKTPPGQDVQGYDFEVDWYNIYGQLVEQDFYDNYGNFEGGIVYQ